MEEELIDVVEIEPKQSPAFLAKLEEFDRKIMGDQTWTLNKI
jgi:hypothetical protein